MEKLMLILLVVFSACSTGRVPDSNDYARASGLIDQGVLHLRAREFKKAWSAFSLSREIADSAAAVDGLGCLAMLEGDSALAEEYFLMAFEMDNTYYNALGNLAQLYEAEGYSGKARKLYARAIYEMPDDFRFRNNYGAMMAEKYEGKEAGLLAEKELRQAGMLQENPLTDINLKILTGDM